MPRFGLVGASYKARSTTADGEFTMNFYPERIESGAGRAGAQSYLIGTQGLKVKWTLPSGPPRGHYTIPRVFPSVDRSFVVSGSVLYELMVDGGYVALGDVGSDGFKAFLDWNGEKLFVASVNKLYTYRLSDGLFEGPIKNNQGEDVAASQICFLDDYMLAPIGGQKIAFSLGGDDWGASDYFSAQASPDDVSLIGVAFGQLWAFGSTTIQPFMASGDFTNPFAPIQSGVIHQGIAGAGLVAQLDNSWFFVGKDPERGGPTVWRTMGYQVRRVSNTALETELSDYDQSAFGLGEAFAFVDGGHPTFQMSFMDSAIDKTWRYDALMPPALGWYQVGYWNGKRFEAHRARTHTFAFGMHLVGDKEATA